ncbi:hypothetical protein [Helicobacter ganmani]|uniref:hypothetical protein n=1 Tax=Helicobacter ganmani TaxID=60246 RepID=UPI003A87DB34
MLSSLNIFNLTFRASHAKFLASSVSKIQDFWDCMFLQVCLRSIRDSNKKVCEVFIEIESANGV